MSLIRILRYSGEHCISTALTMALNEVVLGGAKTTFSIAADVQWILVSRD